MLPWRPPAAGLFARRDSPCCERRRQGITEGTTEPTLPLQRSMMTLLQRGPALLAGLVLLCPVARAAGTDSPGLNLFEKKVRPALVEHCYRCHSAQAMPL